MFHHAGKEEITTPISPRNAHPHSYRVVSVCLRNKYPETEVHQWFPNTRISRQENVHTQINHIQHKKKHTTSVVRGHWALPSLLLCIGLITTQEDPSHQFQGVITDTPQGCAHAQPWPQWLPSLWGAGHPCLRFYPEGKEHFVQPRVSEPGLQTGVDGVGPLLWELPLNLSYLYVFEKQGDM